jgi:RNA-directed DNA polymerase
VEDRVASNSEEVMNQMETFRYEWNDIPWPKLERNVFKLQKRIYQASIRGNVKLLHRLQKLLLKSTSAKLLATRRVTQDNSGKKTAGIDGVAELNQEKRLKLALNLKLKEKGKPVRRVWIPKPGKTEKRPLGIPTMEDRARQALVKTVLEPEWEARFEPNSYGFRPGRSCHDAIEAIYTVIKNKAVYVLDADISGCFNNINHKQLLNKLDTNPKLRRVIKGWLKAGVMEGEMFHKVESGTPQGGVISPLLANIALHGMETDTKEALKDDLMNYERSRTGRPVTWNAVHRTISIIRYADDFIILHRDRNIIDKAKAFIENWLKGIGLELKPAKTRIGHTLKEVENRIGFDFLGFDIRQYPTKSKKLGFKTLTKPSKEAVKRHLFVIRQTLREMRGAPQVAVIAKLNPIVKGWSRYYTTAVARKTFEKVDHHTHQKLWRWAKFRHPHKGEQWVKRKYFRVHGGFEWRFMTHEGEFLILHSDHRIQRHIKVEGRKTPFDGDWIYWSRRLGRTPGIQPRVAKLLKKQNGKCGYCGLYFKAEDRLEVHHLDNNHNNNALCNLVLLHRHCHDNVHGRGTNAKRHNAEEPDESKGSRPVLKPSIEG